LRSLQDRLRNGESMADIFPPEKKKRGKDEEGKGSSKIVEEDKAKDQAKIPETATYGTNNGAEADKNADADKDSQLRKRKPEKAHGKKSRSRSSSSASSSESNKDKKKRREHKKKEESEGSAEEGEVREVPKNLKKILHKRGKAHSSSSRSNSSK